jgi:3-deoxy-D-manno-octulosonic-acid transferase
MINGYDIAYGLGLGLASPFWLAAPKARRKVLKALRERMGRGLPSRATDRPAVWIHAVSLGEINATRAMIKALAERRPDFDFIVSTTTETGYARGLELYGNDRRVTLVRYPLDFSGAIGRALDALKPSLVVLMELEVWPNFLRHCQRRGVPALLVNGRLTPSSFRHYRWGGALTRRMFRRLAMVCAQDETYAERFRSLGAPPERVRVTGTMKFDTAQVADRIDGADDLARAVGLRPGAERVWVCGSTGPGEEELVLSAYRTLSATYPDLRLVIVPRHPERFDEVALRIEREGFPLVRRSASQSAIGNRQSQISPVVLGDTMGELRKFYSLADVVLVGRTLVDLGPRQHGSDMIEPAALARPVVVGRWTHNFAEPMNALIAADAINVVQGGAQLADALGALLNDPAGAAAMGRRAQDVVRRGQGATARHIELIVTHLPPPREAAS